MRMRRRLFQREAYLQLLAGINTKLIEKSLDPKSVAKNFWKAMKTNTNIRKITFESEFRVMIMQWRVF